ncbi:helix-turn-helix transcriptional regulator [Hafnia alvei]|uniref:helix-turn-helix domain-containing protein n=1 Tax=Hafnia alvei TaxID=569 RepID=UPI000C9FCEFA|nr:helix-turn-helix transcriptional regulator [Hafnia alvei]MBI0277297.1 helix-turn-helix transcriptional regulator [Hafnia alvei]PNK96250.1 transcriptional regulator [Hafnia alvei]
MSSEYDKKLKAIRKAEGYTQASFAELTGINIGTIKNYEVGKREVGLSVIDRILKLEPFKKYTMWLMTGDTAPEIGQISPALSPDGSNSISNHQKGQKAG